MTNANANASLSLSVCGLWVLGGIENREVGPLWDWDWLASFGILSKLG